MDSARKIPKEAKTSSKKVVNLKYPITKLTLLDKAVKLHPNSDRTKYILDAVTRAVENDLLDRKDFFLNEKDFDAFEKMLNSPPRDIKTLKALFKEKAPWEK
ncbi:MAG: DUF1778 domain-containing protein [Gammaproteobacteria bacterium]|jgi:uncharacterized protein (DUF1778 family)|nr:DUF1778 domain-containing protein [Gammaproteobacteria bacterium]